MNAYIFHREILHYSQVTTKYTFATRARMLSCAGPSHVWRLVPYDETEVHPTCGGWWHVTKHRSIPRVEAVGVWRNAGLCHVWRLAACDETLIHTTRWVWGSEGLILRSKKLIWTIFKSPVYISQKTHSVSNTKTCFKVRIAVCCENHKKHKYIVGKIYGSVMINLVVRIFTTVMTVKMEVLVFQKRQYISPHYTASHTGGR